MGFRSRHEGLLVPSNPLNPAPFPLCPAFTKPRYPWSTTSSEDLTKKHHVGVSSSVHQQYPQSQPISPSAVICPIYCRPLPFTFNLMQDWDQPLTHHMYCSHFPAIPCFSYSQLQGREEFKWYSISFEGVCVFLGKMKCVSVSIKLKPGSLKQPQCTWCVSLFYPEVCFNLLCCRTTSNWVSYSVSVYVSLFP